MNCILRKWRLSDAKDLAAALNNKKILNNLRDGLPFPYTEQDARDYITAILSSEENSTFAYYWEGRAEVTEFDRVREIGTFKLSIPQADPYGYSLNDNSTPDWLWNPFDFELGVIDDPIQITLTADSPTSSCTISHSAVPFVVSIQVTDIGETGLKMTVDGDDYLLQKGENRLAELLVGDSDLKLNFSGRGSLRVYFRRRVI